MKSRAFEKNGIYLGLLVIIPFLLNWIVIPDVSLTVLSIFFGGLLSIYLVLPTVQHFKQFEFIVKSGHIKDLINYIRVPVFLSLILIVFNLVASSINIPINSLIILTFKSIYIGLWGVFILGLLRIILILPKILLNELNKNKK